MAASATPVRELLRQAEAATAAAGTREKLRVEDVVSVIKGDSKKRERVGELLTAQKVHGLGQAQYT